MTGTELVRMARLALARLFALLCNFGALSRNPRSVIQPRSYALALGVALSLALLQGQTCDRGNTDLVSLELEVDGGPDLIVGFNTANRSYDVSTSGSTVTVRAQAVYAVNDVSWQWLVGTTTIGSGPIGTGSGEVTIPIPDGESLLRVVVKSNQVGSTASGFYRINITKLSNAVTKTITLECNNDILSGGGPITPSTTFAVQYELSLNPLEPIEGIAAGTPFDVELSGTAAVPEWATDQLFVYSGQPPFTDRTGRVEIVELNATVAVRSGAIGADVTLSPTIPTTCLLNSAGVAGLGAGPYPSCDINNDIPVGTEPYANTDCIGLGGAPSTANPCGHIVDIPLIDGTADACAACNALGKPSQCAATNYCVDGDLRIPLTATTATYLANGSPNIVFGYDESYLPSGASISYLDPPGPNGIRVRFSHMLELKTAFECAMGITVDGVELNLLADSEMVSFPPIDRWGTAERISSGTGVSMRSPQVAADPNGNVTAVWAEFTGINFQDNIWASRYIPGGGWGVAELIETGAVGPRVVVDPGGTATAAWYKSGNAYSRRLSPSGTWGPAELISTSVGNPELAVDASGNVAAVMFASGDILSNRYTPGTGWGTAGVISDGMGNVSSRLNVAVNADGNSTALWVEPDGIGDNIWSNRYTPGTGWGVAELIETATAVFEPRVVVDPGGTATAAWNESGNAYSRRSSPSGTWGPVELIGTGGVAELAVDASGNVTAVMTAGDGVLSSRYTPGVGWSGAQLIENHNTPVIGSPTLVVDANGNATAVWSQADGIGYASGTTRYSIFYNRYTPSGGWGAVAGRIETGLGDAGFNNAGRPHVSVDLDGNVTAVWAQWDRYHTQRDIWANRLELP